MHLVLTGATGMTGSAVLRACESAGGCSVTCLVRGGAVRLGRTKARVVEGGLPGPLPDDLFPDVPHVLLHFGSKVIDRDGSGFDLNVEGTKALLGRLPASTAGVIYGSSMSVYGQGAQEGVAEDAPVRPGTPLAVSRARSEELVLDAMGGRGASAFVLRPRFMLGRGDRFVLPGMVSLVRDRRRLVGSGSQAFSIIETGDYAAIILALARSILRRSLEGRPLCRAFNVGYAAPLRFDDFAGLVCRLLDIPLPRKRTPVNETLLRIARRVLPGKYAGAVAALENTGLSHYGNVAALEGEIGVDITGKDPMGVLEKIVREMNFQ